METENHLCDACIQDLTIDDQLAGGFVNKTSDGTAMLDIGNFKLNDWRENRTQGIRASRVRSDGSNRDNSGWQRPDTDMIRQVQRREFYAGQDVERIVVPPGLSELSGSTAGTCRLCERLEELLRQNYDECSWWEDPKSKIRIIIRYEWTEQRARRSWAQMYEEETSPGDERKRGQTEAEEREALPGGGQRGRETNPQQLREAQVEAEELNLWAEEGSREQGRQATSDDDDDEDDNDEDETESTSIIRIAMWGEGPEALPWEKRQKLDCLSVSVHHPGLKDTEADVYKFDVGAWPGKCRDWLKVQCYPVDNAGPVSGEIIEFMKQCIHTCIKDHRRCKTKLARGHFLPTRLLDIGNDNSQSVRLVECEHLPSHACQDTCKLQDHQLKYAALSYCWGGLVDLKTTKATKEAHENGIIVKDMPPVFQDAVYMVRKLGIQYLWIDALCILQDQDDKTDWETESGRMCDVFSNSHITISAAASSSASEHFLQKRNKSLIIRFRSRIRPEISGDYSILLDGWGDYAADTYIRKSRWRTRAWVWQEELMSTRQLIFGEKMMQFRCDKGAMLENGRHDSRDFGTGRIDWVVYQAFWEYAVRDYSSRQLSVPQDRLGAVAGVAKFVQRTLKEAGRPVEYVAGLWLAHTLGNQLRWVCNKPTLSYGELDESFNNAKRYLAPSWSWASKDTAVDHLWWDFSGKTAFQVTSHQALPARKDAMIAVKIGTSLTLRGKCRQTPVLPIRGSLEEKAERFPNQWVTHHRDIGRIKFWLDWDAKIETTKEERRQVPLQLFLLAMEDGHEELRDRGSAGILLLPFENPQGSLYHRVGAFNHHGPVDPLWGEAQECEVTIW